MKLGGAMKRAGFRMAATTIRQPFPGPPFAGMMISLCALFQMGTLLADSGTSHSDSYIALQGISMCVLDFYADRLHSSKPAQETEKSAHLMEVATNETAAMKCDDAARGITATMMTSTDPSVVSAAKQMDACFAARQQIHKVALDMVDKVFKGEHLVPSEIAKNTPDANAALTSLDDAVTSAFQAIAPSLSDSEKSDLANWIDARLPDEQKIYRAGNGDTLTEEVFVILMLRNKLLPAAQ
jgi:hypothetical protein